MVEINVEGAVLLPDHKKGDDEKTKARKVLDDRERKARLTPKQKKRLRILQARKEKIQR